MSDYDNNLKGVLFKNDKKQKETDPMYKGSTTINGQDYWVSAWVNKIKNGEKAGQSYMSLSYTAKEQQQGGYQNQQNPTYQPSGNSGQFSQQVPPQVAQSFPDAEVVDPDIPF